MGPAFDYATGENNQDSNSNHNEVPAQPNSPSSSKARGRFRKRADLGRDDGGAPSAARIFPRELKKTPSFTLPTASPAILPSDNPAPSPLLPALSSPPRASTSSVAFHTGEWTKSLQYFDNVHPAPIDGVNGNGSPPNSPAFRDEPSRGLGSTPNSPSPPHFNSRPVNQVSGYPTVSPRSRQSPVRNRRTSMYSQYTQYHPFETQPPLPHQTQAHYFGAPDTNFGLTKAISRKSLAGADGYFCGFDNLGASDSGASEPVDSVLIVGFEGGLDIYKVDRDKLDVVGHIEGLRGAVIGAKIIPSTTRVDHFSSSRPLVAITIHGPITTTAQQTDQRPSSRLSNAVPEGVRGFEPPLSHEYALENISHYQTTVDVYSLKTREHIATLFASSPVAISSPLTSPLFNPPPPVGNLRTYANGKFIIVASGTSGEVLIFAVRPTDDVAAAGFRCLGKIWTTIQPNRSGSISGSSSATGAESSNAESGDLNAQSGNPLVSLSHRWLAVVPPTPSSLFSLNGTTLVPSSRAKAPGLDTHTAPSQPTANCRVDTPEGDGLFNWMAREMTQEIIKGARWIGDQGKQAWQNYWKKSPTQAGHNGTNNYGRTRDQASHQSNPLHQHFPPTHSYANQSPQSTNEPALVSILDLNKLMYSQDKAINLLNPIATFQAPIGCSFISFAPSGLVLLTASLKGDVQFVWDLMRMVHGKVGLAATSEKGQNIPKGSAIHGPHVRQMARFTRMTATNIVDVVWTAPSGERLAIITEKGTVHIFDIPSKAFQWPQPRRIQRSASAPKAQNIEHVNDVPDHGLEKRGNIFTAAAGLVNDRAQPIFAAVRAQRPSINTSLSTFSGLNLSSAAGAKGGKAVATGISKSLNAATVTVRSLRNAGEYRLHIPGDIDWIGHSCVAWLGGRDGSYIAVLGSGVLRVHDVRRSRAGTNHERRSLPTVGEKALEFALPRILGSDHSTTSALSYGVGKASGFWTLRKLAEPATRKNKGDPHPLSYAEIETNPPYQPFHTDRRINLFVYRTTQSQIGLECPLGLDRNGNHSPWTFGNDIPTTRLNINPSTLDDETDDDGVENAMVTTTQNLKKVMNGDEEVEQVVVTTRRRRGRMGPDEEGFFEDDCEVLDFAEDRV